MTKAGEDESHAESAGAMARAVMSLQHDTTSLHEMVERLKIQVDALAVQCGLKTAA